MSEKIFPYKYDLSAGVCMALVIIVGNLVDKGNNSVLKIVGVSLLVLSVILWTAPIFTFKKYGNVEDGKKYFETNTVVINGVYSLIRHPQYLAYILLVSGFAFIYQNWISFTIAVFAIALFYAHSIEEEKEMLGNYPTSYKNYCENVPRFNLIKSVSNLLTKKRI